MKSSCLLYSTYPYLLSARLVLRKVEETDLDDLFEIYSNERLFSHRPGKARKNRSTVRNMIGHFSRDFHKQKALFLGIALKSEESKLIGIVELFDYDKRVNAVTIGYTLNEVYWGRGYATEATALLVDFLFDTIGIHRIQAYVMPENDRSRNVLRKNGFTLEGTIREGSYWKDKGIIDLELYSLLAREHPIHAAESLGNQNNQEKPTEDRNR